MIGDQLVNDHAWWSRDVKGSGIAGIRGAPRDEKGQQAGLRKTHNLNDNMLYDISIN